MRPAAFLVVVPTTGGPLVVRSLRVRRELPAPAAFAEGDYRPLPWSGDYARLAGADGPLSRLAQAGPHELRLSGSFDAGRSWEAPVCLAHGLVARGHRLVAEPEEADRVLWATGAVDLDLAVLPGDYALLDKIERSRALLGRAPGAGLAVLLPEGPERGEAEGLVRALGRARPPDVLPAGSVPAALLALDAVPAERAAPARPRRLALPAAAAAGLAGAAVLGAVYARTPSVQAPRSAEVEADAPAAPAGTPSAAVTAGATPVETPAPAVLVEELVAPARSSCRRVAFGADPPVRRPVPEETPGRLRPSRLAPDLCGLALRPGLPGTRVEVGPELRAAAMPPSLLPDGARAYYLREGARRDLVYAAQAIPEGGAPGAPLVHALTR